MMKKLLSTSIAVVASFLLLSVNCYASNMYLGAGFGQSKLKNAGSCSDLTTVYYSGYTCSIDDTDTSYNAFFGYTFTPNIAAEVGYTDLGKYTVSASGVVLGTSVTVAANGEFKAKGWTASAVGTFPLTPSFSLLGRLGVFQWDADLNGSGSSGSTTASFSETASGTDPLYGVGVQWNVNPQFSVRGEWTRFSNVGDGNKTGESDIDNLSINALFNF